MNQSSHPVIITVRVTTLGTIICIALVLAIVSFTLPIINFIKPPSPQLPICLVPVESELTREELYPDGCREPGLGVLWYGFGDEFRNALLADALSVLLSVGSIWIVGFSSGLYLRNCRGCSTVGFWNSMISGFVIGLTGVIVLSINIPGPERPGDPIAYTIISVTTAVFGLVGYFLARFVKKKRSVALT